MAQNKQRSQFDLMHPIFDAMKRDKLPTTQRMLLLALYRYMNGKGVCYPSYKSLMEETGLSRQCISTNIKKLTSQDWISYKQGNKAKAESNTYFLNLVKIGLEVDSVVVPIVHNNSFVAPDGSIWDCPASYWKTRQLGIN